MIARPFWACVVCIFFVGLVLIPAPLCGQTEQKTAPESREQKPQPESATKPSKEQKQDEAQPPISLGLETVEVLAPPILEGTSVNRYGSAVTTVSRGQIEALNAQDLPSALRHVPGVTISRYNIIGSYGGADGGAIYIRGMGSTRPGADILTMVDGIPKFVGVWAHPLMDTLSIDPVDHINIYKSAQPVFLGNMSFAAVDLVTRRRTKPGFETEFTTGLGSFLTFTEAFAHGGKIKDFDYYFTQSYKRSDGHRKRSDGELQDYFARVGYDLTKNLRLDFTFSHTDNWARDPGPRTAPPPPAGKFSIEDFTYVGTLSNKFSWGEGFVKFYWDDGSIDWEQWQSKTPAHAFHSLTDYDNYGIRIKQAIWPWREGELVLGLDQDYMGGKFVERHPTYDRLRSDFTFHLTAPYMAFSQLFGDKKKIHVTPSAGLRYNYHSEFDDTWTPQTGVVLGYSDKTKVWFNYAHAVNYPGVWAAVNYLGWNRRDWRELEPEDLDHFEVGAAHWWTKWLKSEFTAFWDYGANRIVFDAPPPHFENFPKFSTQGIEISSTIEPVDWFSAYAGASFITRRSPERLPNAPGGTFMAGVAFKPHKRLVINMDASYISDQYKINPRYPGTPAKIDGYFLLGGKATFDFTPEKAYFKRYAYIALENITDSEYEYRPGYPMPGTTLMGGLKIKF